MSRRTHQGARCGGDGGNRARATDRLVHFEENAQTLFRAAALGEVKGLSQEEMDGFEKRFNRRAHIGKLWKYYTGRGVDAGYLPRDWAKEISGKD